MKNKKTKIAVIVIIILSICLILVCEFFSLKYIGKRSLLKESNRIVNGKNLNGDEISECVNVDGKEYLYNDDLINILVLGIDNEMPVDQKVLPGDLGQSDAIYLVSINYKTGELKVVGIPRDTIVPVEMYYKNNEYVSTENMQITLQYAYGDNCKRGSQLTANAVSGLLGNIPIQRVCVMKLDAIEYLNDVIGGVTVTINHTFTDESGLDVDESFYEGNVVTLKGEQALKFVLERDCSLFASAMTRVSNQEQYMREFSKQMKLELKKKPYLAWKIYRNLKHKKYLYTDINISECIYLSSQLDNFHLENVDIDTIPGSVMRGEWFEEYHADDLTSFVIEKFYIEK